MSAASARWGRSAVLVHVTDGAPVDGVDAQSAGFPDAEAYTTARRSELNRALAYLPAFPIATVQLGETDQRVTDHLFRVVRALRRLIVTWAPATVVTHAYKGGHPDHDAIAVAVHALRRERTTFVHLEFAEYYQGRSGELVTNRFPTTTPATVRIRLSNQEQQMKRDMLSAFTSQQRTLACFGVEEEWLRPAPEYDFSRPPNEGRVWYERFPWAEGVEARRSRSAAQLGRTLDRLQC